MADMQQWLQQLRERQQQEGPNQPMQLPMPWQMPSMQQMYHFSMHQMPTLPLIPMQLPVQLQHMHMLSQQMQMPLQTPVQLPMQMPMQMPMQPTTQAMSSWGNPMMQQPCSITYERVTVSTMPANQTRSVEDGVTQGEESKRMRVVEITDERKEELTKDEEKIKEKVTDSEKIKEKFRDDEKMNENVEDDEKMNEKVEDDKKMNEKVGDDEKMNEKVGDDEKILDSLPMNFEWNAVAPRPKRRQGSVQGDVTKKAKKNDDTKPRRRSTRVSPALTSEKALQDLEKVPPHMIASSKFQEEHLKAEAIKVLAVVETPECQDHLLQVANGTIKRDESMMGDGGLGPFNLFKDLQVQFLDMLELQGTEAGPNFKYQVMVPEAIIFALMKIHQCSWKAASKIFAQHSAIVEPYNSGFQN